MELQSNGGLNWAKVEFKLCRLGVHLKIYNFGKIYGYSADQFVLIRSAFADQIQLNQSFLLGILIFFAVVNHLSMQYYFLLKLYKMVLRLVFGWCGCWFFVGCWPLDEVRTREFDCYVRLFDCALKGADIDGAFELWILQQIHIKNIIILIKITWKFRKKSSNLSWFKHDSKS